MVFPQTPLIKIYPSGGSVCSVAKFSVQSDKLIHQTHPQLTAHSCHCPGTKWGRRVEGARLKSSACFSSKPKGLLQVNSAERRCLCHPLSFLLSLFSSRLLFSLDYLSSTMCPWSSHLVHVLSPVLQYNLCPSPFTFSWAFPFEFPILFTQVSQLHFFVAPWKNFSHLCQFSYQY